jgi:hypothetical protein
MHYLFESHSHLILYRNFPIFLDSRILFYLYSCCIEYYFELLVIKTTKACFCQCSWSVEWVKRVDKPLCIERESEEGTGQRPQSISVLSRTTYRES